MNGSSIVERALCLFFVSRYQQCDLTTVIIESLRGFLSLLPLIDFVGSKRLLYHSLTNDKKKTQVNFDAPRDAF